MYIEKLSRQEHNLVLETDYDLLVQARERAINEADRSWAQQLVLAKLELAGGTVSWQELDELAQGSTDDNLIFVKAVASVKMQVEDEGHAEAISPAEDGGLGEPTPDTPFLSRTRLRQN